MDFHDEEGNTGLDKMRTRMLKGVLSLNDAKAEEVMTPISMVELTLTFDDVIDQQFLCSIKKNKFSRVPIKKAKDTSAIVGVLLTKSLIGVDISQRKTVAEMYKAGQIDIKVPLYLKSSTCEILGEAGKAFCAG